MLKVKYLLNSEKLEEEYLGIFNGEKYRFNINSVEIKGLKELFPKESLVNLNDMFNKLIKKVDNEILCLFQYTIIESFKDLLFIKPEEIPQIIEDIESRITEDLKKRLKTIFKYDGKFQSPISQFFEQYVDTYSCYFCNINFINDYQDKNGKAKNEFTLDHYFDKADYPYLALSLYNLVPSCYTCNSKLKGTKNISSLAPTSDKSDFNEKVKFKLFLSAENRNLSIQKPEDIEIPLKENYSDNYSGEDENKYINVFKLNERYKTHKKEAFDLIEKVRLYPDSRLEEMQKLTGLPKEQIKANIFNIPTDDNNLHKRPLSKLIKDTSEELGLLN